MKILYFADIRHALGLHEEILSLPESVSTLADLRDYLCNKGENYKKAFATDKVIRCSVNCEFSDFSAEISDSDEVAFFPPVTGG